jgi:hypothetical protein
MTLPALSTATHRVVEGQEMASRGVLPSTSLVVHADAPPVGPVEPTTLPALSTATHRVVEGQEILSTAFGWRCVPVSTSTGVVQVVMPDAYAPG